MKFKILMISLILASVFLIAACTNNVVDDEPRACTKEYMPVCGIDNVTYGNKCAAGNVEIAHEGECVAKESQCLVKEDCACGISIETGDCAFGNKNYINAQNQCPDFCSGIAGHLEIKCEQNKCVQSQVQIANPASTFCVNNGGILEIRKDTNGGEVGYCKIAGQECEEWSLFRGECSEIHICTAEQKAAEICTMEYMPVCGNDGVTHGNGCSACSAKVDYYVPGEC